MNDDIIARFSPAVNPAAPPNFRPFSFTFACGACYNIRAIPFQIEQ